MTPITRTLLICGALVLTADAARAQLVTSWKPSASDCQQAADSLSLGSRTRDAWGFIAGCGTTGTTAIATAIRNVRVASVQDTIYLTDLFTVASAVQEPSVLDEATILAEAKAAPLAARVFGLMVMLAQHDPHTAMMGRGGWRELTTIHWGEHCPFQSTEGSYRTLIPMPADFRQRIASSTERIAGDGAEAPVVRGLARCIRLTLRASVPESVRADLLQLEYVCGTKFVARSTAAKAATLRYEVDGTTEAGDLALPAQGVTYFMTVNVGTVLLLQNDVLVTSAANGGTTCP